MNVIGIGSAGTALAEKFREYKQYNIYKIDVGLCGENCYGLRHQKTPEEYEEKAPSFKRFFKDLKGEILLIIGGSGYISAVTLRVLHAIKQRKIANIIYIRPDLALLPQTKKRFERATYNILQEYARSGAISQIYLVDNIILGNIIGDVSIIDYFDKINYLIVNTFHMLNVYKNSQPVLGAISTPNETSRISTIGVFDIETGKENLFFPLDKIKESCYIYSINENRLQEEGDLHSKITTQMRERAKCEDTNTSFGVFSTNYKNDYGFLLVHSSTIQP
jgi:hypothetical protein